MACDQAKGGNRVPNNPNLENAMPALLGQACRDVEESRQAIAESRLLRRRAWEGLAGAELDRMLESPDTTARYLEHSDPKLRRVALSILTSHWQPTASAARECERLELQDPDPEVRKTARSCLISSYSKLHDPRLAQVFARIVKDESESPDSRISAYESLFQLLGLPPDRWPGMRMRLGELSFPEDVDWDMVENCLHSLETR
jgi:hypothetical protein